MEKTPFGIKKFGIFVPSGMKSSHSFDLYGTLLDSEAMCKEHLELWEELPEIQEMPEEDREKIRKDYMALARNEPEANARKIDIINPVYNPLKQAGVLGEAKEQYHEDVVPTLRSIIGAGEEIVVFTSKPWIPTLPEDIKISHVYNGDKSDPKNFQIVAEQEASYKRRMITHTEDSLKQIEAGRASRLEIKLITVSRDNNTTPELASLAGTDMYCTDLRQIGYARK